MNLRRLTSESPILRRLAERRGRGGWRARITVVTLALASLTAGAPTAAAAATPSLSTPAQTTPFTPGVPFSTPSVTTPATPTVAVTNTSTTGSGGLSGSEAAFIAIGAVIVLGGIALFIWRDARRHAPRRGDRDAFALDGSGPRTGSKPRTKPRKLSPAERRRRKRGRARSR